VRALFCCWYVTVDSDALPTLCRGRGQRVGRRGGPGQHVGVVPDGPGLDGDPRRRDSRGEERRRGREQRRGSDAGDLRSF